MRDSLGDVESVLVLGGRSEIAMAAVRALVARRTRTVVLAVRDPATVTHELAELRAAGAEASAVTFDATAFATHDAVLRDVWAAHGDIDVVIVAFAVMGDEDESAHDERAARAVIDTTFTGAVTAMNAAADLMEQQGHGSIVVLSSVAAMRPRQKILTYAAAKAGLDAYARGLGDRLHGTGVDVTLVRPGFVHTRMTAGKPPAPFATDAPTVGKAIVEGIRRRSPVVFVPDVLRAAMPVLQLLPRPVWRRLRE
ncbi:MAG TPA: SDR family NAD(P)-dependent oxidoreductase [Acidimicrobiia bacterium]